MNIIFKQIQCHNAATFSFPSIIFVEIIGEAEKKTSNKNT